MREVFIRAEERGGGKKESLEILVFIGTVRAPGVTKQTTL